MMEFAYKNGVRGFDLSLRSNVIEAFRRLKEKYGAEVIGIGNPNWLCGYELDNKPLMNFRDRVILTIISRYYDSSTRSKLNSLPENQRCRSFHYEKNTQPLSEDEVGRITLNRSEWVNRLNVLKELVDFCQVGTDYADWMVQFGKVELLSSQISMIREKGMIPISICHWTSHTLPTLEREDVAGHWVWANKKHMCLNFADAISAIGASRKPKTAFRVLKGLRLPDQIPEVYSWIRSSLGIMSVVIGIDDEAQGTYTIPTARSTFCR
jgi:hypothetical protein